MNKGLSISEIIIALTVFSMILIIIIYSSIRHGLLDYKPSESIEYVGIDRHITTCYFEFDLEVEESLSLQRSTLSLIHNETLFNVKEHYTLYEPNHVFEAGNHVFVIKKLLTNPFHSCSAHVVISLEITFIDKFNKEVSVIWEK